MNSRDFYLAIKELLSKAGVEDAGFEAEQLILHVTGHSHLHPEELEEEDRKLLMQLAGRRAARQPLQYVLGGWSFLGIQLHLGPGVLIPRPETEEVCVAAAALVAELPAPQVLDLCSGSGALALGLQSFLPQADIWALELSPAALNYLRRNLDAWFLGESHFLHPPACQALPKVPRAIEGDVFAYWRQLKPQSLDLVVCNPPYVTEAEYETLSPEVHAEPRQALVADDDGLAFYKAIAQHYAPALRPGGWLVFEIGAAQGPAVLNILRANHYEALELRRDLSGNHRIAIGQKVQA